MAMIDGTGAGDVLVGTNDDDVINGLGGDDTVLGLGGNDTLAGQGGNDSLDGGDGQDFVRGGGGENTLSGGVGDDLISVFGARDVLDGGPGIDRAGFFNEPGGVTVDLRISRPQWNGWEFVTLTNFENLSGGLFNDHLIGDEGANWLWGSLSGDDTLTGLGGDDLLGVGEGHSIADGGPGVDTINMDGNGSFTSGVTLNLALQGVEQATGHGTVVLISVENASGSEFADTLSSSDMGALPGGGAGADHPGPAYADAGGHVQAGNILAGNLGDDLIAGGHGDDLLLGDGTIGTDYHGVGTSGPITVSLENPSGPGGADTLSGGAGDDTLVGGDGADLLRGGGGSDHFVYLGLNDSAPGASDRIVDLQTTDVIDLSAIDANTGLAGDQAFHQVNAFTHHAGELVLDYDASADATYLRLDVDGDGHADMSVEIAGRATNFDNFIF